MFKVSDRMKRERKTVSQKDFSSSFQLKVNVSLPRADSVLTFLTSIYITHIRTHAQEVIYPSTLIKISMY